MDPLDDVTTQLTLDMEQTLSHSTSEEFPVSCVLNLNQHRL